MSMTLNRGNGTKKIRSRQQKRIVIRKLGVQDPHAGVKLIGLSTAKEFNVSIDYSLCKLDTIMI